VRLAQKAFAPGKVPFPLLHIDTGHNFPEVIEFRDRLVREHGLELLVGSVQASIDAGRVREEAGPRASRNRLQTVTLLDAIESYELDACFGGARRDEERARAKERVLSFRDDFGTWDPRRQRPELWDLYNGRHAPGEHVRVFPLSNWTELDVWQYIHLENIPIVPLYYAAVRPVVERNGMLIMVDDDRLDVKPGETVEYRSVRFRTLGCYPLTGAVESTADTLPKIIQEMLLTRTSERQGRLIDHDQAGSMEKKKQEGYF
jgi:sulfate adenylyltransferase subunit 2